MFAYPAYFAGLALLVGALLFGREVNGAKAWFEFGSFRMQPVEFVKIATALALARVMSAYSFSINRPGDLFKVGMVICVPLFIIILQNDTGSGIVLGSFLFVLYREGLNKWLCIPVLLIAALFIFSFLLSPMTMLVSIILVCTLSQAMMNGHWRQCLVYLAALALGSILLCMAMGLVAPGFMDLHACLLTVTLLSLVWVVVYAYRTNLNNIFITVGLFLCTVVFLPTTNYIFNSILKPHQQDRILSFLGIISDPLGTDYNVNQSKIAIGSGGFLGKGFLQGIRAEIKNGTELGKTAKGYIDQGQLLPDELIIDILASTLDSFKDSKGVIFDGFPRTIAQAEALKKMLSERGQEVSIMLDLDVPEDELMTRLIKRGQESGRADDNEETIKKRLTVYHSQTAPLIDWYKKEGKYQHINGLGYLETITQDICKAVDAVK